MYGPRLIHAFAKVIRGILSGAMHMIEGMGNVHTFAPFHPPLGLKGLPLPF